MKLSEALKEQTGTVSIFYGHSDEAKAVIQDAIDGKYDHLDNKTAKTAKTVVPKEAPSE